MAKIDNDKMWESILSFRISEEEEKELMDSNPLQAALFFIGQSIKKGLKDQGLEYNPETKEIQEIDYLWNGEIRVRKVTGVLKKMLDNIDEEELQKTREEMLKESSDGELSEFEIRIYDWCSSDSDGQIDRNTMHKISKNRAKILLEIARKQLQPEIDAEIEKAYKTQDEVQYKCGYRKAIEDSIVFLYKQLHDGKVECGNIEEFIDDYRKMEEL